MDTTVGPGNTPFPRFTGRFEREAPRRTWLARWQKAMSAIAELQRDHPLVDAVVEEQQGRKIRVGGRTLIDFASCNYLGLDLDREIIEAIPAYLDAWGTHPSWSRSIASPVLYEQIEERLTALLGAGDALVLPTITQIHTSVIPVLADAGTIFLDQRAHRSFTDGCTIAQSHGATVERFAHNDLDELEALLQRQPHGPRLICTDGVNSMTGNVPDLPGFARLAREHDALLYVDDAHGFGLIGERAEDELCDYGKRGNAIVRHFDESYDNIVLVGGFSKAYSSLLAFVAAPTSVKRLLKSAVPPYIFSGPVPVASLATVLEGFNVNERRGDVLRADLHRRTRRLLDVLEELDVYTPNSSGLPIIEIPVGRSASVDDVGLYLYERGIFATLAPFPVVPRDEAGFRLQVTAANTDEEIEHAADVLVEVAERFEIAGSRSRHMDVATSR